MNERNQGLTTDTLFDVLFLSFCFICDPRFRSDCSHPDDGTWQPTLFNAHGISVNAVSFTPSPTLLSSSVNPAQTIRLATGGSDSLVRIWKEENGAWVEEAVLEGHGDWVRDVCWAGGVGGGRTLASCGQVRSAKRSFLERQERSVGIESISAHPTFRFLVRFFPLVSPFLNPPLRSASLRS